jgi:hypothetical protein
MSTEQLSLAAALAAVETRMKKIDPGVGSDYSDLRYRCSEDALNRLGRIRDDFSVEPSERPYGQDVAWRLQRVAADPNSSMSQIAAALKDAVKSLENQSKENETGLDLLARSQCRILGLDPDVTTKAALMQAMGLDRLENWFTMFGVRPDKGVEALTLAVNRRLETIATVYGVRPGERIRIELDDQSLARRKFVEWYCEFFEYRLHQFCDAFELEFDGAATWESGALD